MKLAVICNNYGQNYDGIGAYTAAICEKMEQSANIKIYTNKCKASDSKLKKFTTMGMMQAIHNLKKCIRKIKYDAVIIEYPFVEWNPFIIFSICALSKKLKKNKIKFIVSIHEYERVNVLRKFIIKCIACKADAIFITNKNMAVELKKCCSISYIRKIPSNIERFENGEIIEKDKTQYVFFGLINQTKAFDEMLKAWDDFNRDKEKTLHIISGTYIENIEEMHKGIKYHYNLSSEEISSVMKKCAFCIVPVKPFVDEKNTTFKTGCAMGNVCIALYANEFKCLDFIINMDDYSEIGFLNALKKAEAMDVQELKKHEKKALEFAEKYKTENIANEILQNIKKIVKEQ